MNRPIFFDNASTTRCCEEAARLVLQYAVEDFGNPSSSHQFGLAPAKAIREARLYFAQQFKVEQAQVVFTGSGTESDNLALSGTAHAAFSQSKPVRILTAATEHPAVKRTAQALTEKGAQIEFIPVRDDGQIDWNVLEKLLKPAPLLVSIHQVNNITGARLPVEQIAAFVKERSPQTIFHTDSVQAFGKVPHPTAASKVDLVSISAHKIHGPKGVGALIVLNKKLLQSGLRPLIWGGGQEGGFRSGTQNAGLIAGFHAAAKIALDGQPHNFETVRQLKSAFKSGLREHGLLADETEGSIRWNSPENAVPHIVSLSLPGYPGGPLARLLEERRCAVSTGSACSSQKPEPDAVLAAMGLPHAAQVSAVRVSFSRMNTLSEVETLVSAFKDSIELMNRLQGPPRKKKKGAPQS